MKTALMNMSAGVVIAVILGTGYSVLDKFGQVAEVNRAIEKDERVVIGHRIDSMGNFQLVYKTN